MSIYRVGIDENDLEEVLSCTTENGASELQRAFGDLNERESRSILFKVLQKSISNNVVVRKNDSIIYLYFHQPQPLKPACEFTFIRKKEGWYIDGCVKGL
ncbi:MAG: hypothetical protein AAGI38_21120 [Bacteroidota bacterium]